MTWAAQPRLHRTRWFGLLALVVLLGACGQAHVVRREPEPSHVSRAVPATRHPGANEVEVARGDTLYGIAFRNGMDFRELASINGIDPPYTIYVGQVLRLHGDHARANSASPPVAQVPRPVRNPPAPRPSHSPTPSSPAVRPPVASSTNAPSVPGSFETVPAPADATQADASPPPDASHAPATAAVAPVSAHPIVATPGDAATVVASASHPVPRTPSAPILPSVVAPAGGVGWHWPARGALLERFAAGDATRQGIDIAGTAGEPVLGTADGVVVYSGSGLVGYGELVIVKHSDEWLSAYGHNRKRLVTEGQRVRAGQPIAEMGSTGAPRDELHFEIRRNGRPVDPLQFLPGR